MKIVLASNNQGKLAELQAMLTPLGCTLITQGSLGVPEAPLAELLAPLKLTRRASPSVLPGFEDWG